MSLYLFIKTNSGAPILDSIAPESVGGLDQKARAVADVFLRRSLRASLPLF